MNRLISVTLWLVVICLAVTTYFGGLGQTFQWWLSH